MAGYDWQLTRGAKKQKTKKKDIAMKALVKTEPKKGIWMKDVPIPQTGVNDVLIKIRKTAICGTDLHIYKWDEWSQKLSLIHI